ncbi:FtsX-like permease family protein [Kurthia massiliensis]|uniref:FtsX-like permease family protein n=1 Tax=Kurthia massiliensis TaxID=1033739 RepID=UPI000287CE7E|nr:ABC transporter permease [Kurthia massiliensis]
MTFRQFAYRNVVRNYRIYAAFFLASVSSVMVFFIYSMLMYHPRVENEFMIDIAFRGMYIAQIILVLFMLFFLFYSMRAFLEARSKEFGILMQLGMEKQQLNKLVTFETMLIGMASTFVGILFGFAFSKFFFMVIREILQISALPIYFSWKPFALTIMTFTTLFIVVSQLSVWTIKDQALIHLLRGTEKEEQTEDYSKLAALTGFLLLGLTYYMMLNVDKNNLLFLSLAVPPIMTVGTYFFFIDSTLMIVDLLRKMKFLYWRKYHLLAWSEYAKMLKANSKMFFLSSVVSTLAFLAIGTLGSMSAFTHQYHQLNPVNMLYISKLGNSYERQHIISLQRELNKKSLEYKMTTLVVKPQTSSATNKAVQVLSEAQFNDLAKALDEETVKLKRGQAIFLPYSYDSYESLKNKDVQTTLVENGVDIRIKGAYPNTFFSKDELGVNAIIVDTEDFNQLYYNKDGYHVNGRVDKMFAFTLEDWTDTQYVGQSLDRLMTESFISGSENVLPFYYKNTGIDYEVLRSTFALILFIGILASSVFFMAAGSFIYFKLYANLDGDQRQYATLRRMGVTDREIRHLVNRQLIPQFFLPWGVAVINSSFAFIGLQVFWEGVADMSIAQTLIMVFCVMTGLQLLYFYMIRWRYLAHLK